jgi:serine/threonine protein phosphatase PrpC
MITAFPDIRVEKIVPGETQFLILACDGIWDCLTSQEAVNMVGDLIPKKKRVSEVVEEMFDKIIAADVASSGGIGCDNMTCIVVEFK